MYYTPNDNYFSAADLIRSLKEELTLWYVFIRYLYSISWLYDIILCFIHYFQLINSNDNNKNVCIICKVSATLLKLLQKSFNIFRKNFCCNPKFAYLRIIFFTSTEQIEQNNLQKIIIDLLAVIVMKLLVSVSSTQYLGNLNIRCVYIWVPEFHLCIYNYIYIGNGVNEWAI